jgi:hypothetical protein
MFPLCCDVSVLSKVDLQRPSLEYVTSATTLDPRLRCACIDLSLFLINDKNMEQYRKLIGTKFVSEQKVKTTTTDEDFFSYFTDNYDLVSVPPPSKTIRVKVHVKSRSKFIPKIII